MKKLYLIFFILLFSKYSFGKDSTYVVEEFNFKVQSIYRFGKFEPYPFTKNNFDSCAMYMFGETMDEKFYYSAEVWVTDCRQRLIGKSKNERTSFFAKFFEETFNHRYPTPSFSTYNNTNCIIGTSYSTVTVSGKSKKVKEKYLVFYNGDFIYEIRVSDSKKDVSKSFENFLSRFSLIQ